MTANRKKKIAAVTAKLTAPLETKLNTVEKMFAKNFKKDVPKILEAGFREKTKRYLLGLRAPKNHPEDFTDQDLATAKALLSEGTKVEFWGLFPWQKKVWRFLKELDAR